MTFVETAGTIIGIDEDRIAVWIAKWDLVLLSRSLALFDPFWPIKDRVEKACGSILCLFHQLFYVLFLVCPSIIKLESRSLWAMTTLLTNSTNLSAFIIRTGFQPILLNEKYALLLCLLDTRQPSFTQDPNNMYYIDFCWMVFVWTGVSDAVFSFFLWILSILSNA